MKWITRERPKIDGIACTWLIKNFIDKEVLKNLMLFLITFLDKGNYYTVRANPFEDKVVLYKVQSSSRTNLPL